MNDELDSESPASETATEAPEAPEAPAAAPADNTIDVIAPRRPKTTAELAQDLNNHDLEFQQDLAKGTIKPETYQDLYDKKDTTGKIGTLFGLMLSGMGSGLSGQPNAVMDMMNKELDRDLDAQKHSNTNTQNWYNLSMQHQLQQAQIPQIEAQTGQANAGAYEHAVAGDVNAAKLKQLPGADMTATLAAKNKMLIANYQQQQNSINKMAPGPVRDAAQNLLESQIGPATTTMIQENNLKIAGHKKLVEALSPPKPADGAPSGAGAINYPKLQEMIKDSRMKSNLGLAPTVTESDIAKIQDEASEIEANRVAMKMYNHAFTKLWQAKDKGSLNQDLYNAETSILGPEAAKATAGRFNQQEANKQTSGMFPTWRDFVSGAGPEKYNNTMNYFKGKEEGATTLKRFPQLKTPAPDFPSPFAGEKKKAGPALKDGETGKDSEGRPWQVKGGKRIYTK